MVGLLLQTGKVERMNTENEFEQIVDHFVGDDTDFDDGIEHPTETERHRILSTEKFTRLISERLASIDYDTEGNISVGIEKELENFFVKIVESEEEKRLSLEYMIVTQRDERRFSGVKADNHKTYSYDYIPPAEPSKIIRPTIHSANEPLMEKFYGFERIYAPSEGRTPAFTEKIREPEFVSIESPTVYFLADPERLYSLVESESKLYVEKVPQIVEITENFSPAVYIEAGVLYSLNKNKPFEYNGQFVIGSFIFMPKRNYSSIIEMLQEFQSVSGGGFNIKVENRELNGTYVPYVAEIVANGGGKKGKYIDGKDGYFLESYVFDGESEEIDIGRLPWHLQPVSAYEPVEIRYGKETDQGCGSGGYRNGDRYKLDIDKDVMVNELLDMRHIFNHRVSSDRWIGRPSRTF